MKRRVLSALCCIVLLSVISMTAFALEVPDLDRTGSISITMTYQDEVVPGGSLTLYRVADVHLENDADYSFRYTSEYADSQVPLDDLGDPNIALLLAEYTVNNNISGTKVQIDENGEISFENLELGLYLLIQQDAADGYELVSPFLVSVPARGDSGYIYDVDASPKLALEREPEPDEPPDDPPPPDLPQTGLNKWPIPVMAISGLLLAAVGMVLYTVGKKKSHEG